MQSPTGPKVYPKPKVYAEMRWTIIAALALVVAPGVVSAGSSPGVIDLVRRASARGCARV